MVNQVVEVKRSGQSGNGKGSRSESKRLSVGDVKQQKHDRPETRVIKIETGNGNDSRSQRSDRGQRSEKVDKKPHKVIEVEKVTGSKQKDKQPETPKQPEKPVEPRPVILNRKSRSNRKYLRIQQLFIKIQMIHLAKRKYLFRLRGKLEASKTWPKCLDPMSALKIQR